tara:strand:- start:71 stop:265 length:195 start_codon:yes stop_codon:yes gene_type:complete
MIVVDKSVKQIMWWITYNEDKSIVDYGETEPEQQTETGLPLCLVYDNEQSWLEALYNDFNIIPE